MGIVHLLEAAIEKTVRILVFHRVSPVRLDDGMTVSETVFDAQIQYLTKNHHVVSLGDAAAMLRGQRPLKRGTVAISLDDGYRDNFLLALPILAKHRAPATVFLAVGAIDGSAPLWTEELRKAIWTTSRDSVDLSRLGWGAWPLGTEGQKLACLRAVKARLKAMPDKERKRMFAEVLLAIGHGRGMGEGSDMLTWEMVRAMRKEGIAIGAHSVSHKILTRIDRPEAEWEIAESKRRIEQQLGEPVRHFAYPNGTSADWTPEIEAMVKQAGFETACTTVRGANPVGHDVYALRRLEINDAGCTDPFGRFSPAMFAAQLVGLFGGWER